MHIGQYIRTLMYSMIPSHTLTIFLTSAWSNTNNSCDTPCNIPGEEGIIKRLVYCKLKVSCALFCCFPLWIVIIYIYVYCEWYTYLELHPVRKRDVFDWTDLP